MKTRTLTITLGAGALVAGLAACGQDSSQSSGGAANSSGGGTVASNLIMGGPAEFQTRGYGLPGLQKNYGIQFGKFTVADPGSPVQVSNLKNGQIDVADIFTTDPSIKANNFVVLQDPKHDFAAQNIVPIVAKAKATDGVKATLNPVSAKLTTDSLSALDEQVQDKKMDPGTVAQNWLQQNGFTSTGQQAKGVSFNVGSANFPESTVLADIYAGALKNQGANVTTTLNIGSREKYFPALQSGSLDLMPDYTGNVLSFLDKSATATSENEVYAALQKALPGNLTVLDKSPAQDSDALVVTQDTANKYHLKTIADLAQSGS